MKKKNPLPAKIKLNKARASTKFVKIIGSFYSALRKEQLSDEELRACFKKHNHEWIKACIKYNLSFSSRSNFAKEIQETFIKKQKIEKKEKKD